MDKARRLGGWCWVLAGAVFQLVQGSGGVRPGPATLALIAAVTVLAALSGTPGTPRLTWLAAWIVALLLGLEFAGAVADRLGLLGAPGAPEVSWGNWEAFVRYTQVLLPGPLKFAAPLAAALATVTEVALAVLLLTGWQRRWVAKAAAGLLGVYLLFMAFSVGLHEVARYGVPVLIGGALLVSSCSARRPDHQLNVSAS